jgi:phosphoglycerol transferase
VGLSLDVLGRRLSGWRRFAGRGRIWSLVALALVLVVGVYDQSTLTAIPPYYANGVAYGNDGLFVAQIQRLMPRQASIFELPYVPFPENPPVGRMLDYDLGRGYVHTTDGLSWSYGAIKGRPQDWQAATVPLPLPTQVDGAVAAGFSGIWIDTYGYADNGASVINGIRSLIGEAPIVSRNQREVFFDLRPYAARLRAAVGPKAIAALGSAILHPPSVTYGNGVYPPDANGNIWTNPDAIASISNTSGRTRRMIFYASVQTAGRGHFHLTITAPDGTVRHVAIGHNPKPVRFEFTDPVGTHGIGFASDAPITPIAGDPRQLAVYYANPAIDDASLEPFLPEARAASAH